MGIMIVIVSDLHDSNFENRVKIVVWGNRMVVGMMV